MRSKWSVESGQLSLEAVPTTRPLHQRYLDHVLAFDIEPGFAHGNGEGGIRTLGTLLGYGALAKRCFRPLSHLTKIDRARIWRRIAECQLLNANC
jgi:hypothetical protein